MAEADTTVFTLNVNGRDVPARAGQMVIAAADDAGIHIPRFCYHPRLRSPAMCRMCLVEIEGMRGLQPACYVPVADGMVVRTDTPAVTKVQEGVLELLLVNHPLDCPVCDRGGECPLQDHTVAYGPGESRFVEDKRHFEKPVPISDLVLLDRERCIQCSRCTRFAQEVAGDPLIDFAMRGNDLQISTFPDDPFASYFSGNVVQVCPVGALTAVPYRFQARPWDVATVETTCTMCAVGCRGALDAATDRLTRLLGVDADCVNNGWLCDKGRFGYEYVASPERLTEPLRRPVPRSEGRSGPDPRSEGRSGPDPRSEGRSGPDGDAVAVSWAEAIETVATEVERTLRSPEPLRVAAIGGGRLTNEEAYALGKFMRVVCGSNDVDCQMGDGLPARFVVGAGTGERPTFQDLNTAPAVVLSGPDLKEELPVLYLRVREAVTVHGVPLTIAGNPQSGLECLGERVESLAHVTGLAEGTVVIVGRAHLGEDGDAVAAAALALVQRCPGVRVLPVLRRGNTHGALDMGLAPDLLPGRGGVEDPAARSGLAAAWTGEFPAEAGLDTRGILEAAAGGEVGVLFLVGADPLADFPDPDLARRALEGARFLAALDLFPTASTALADLVLPSAGWGEVDGTVTNVEGRVQRVAAKVTPPGLARTDVHLFAEVSARLGTDLGCSTPQGTLAEIAAVAPAYAGITLPLLRRPDARRGLLTAPGTVRYATPGRPGEPHTGEGTHRLVVRRSLYDCGTLVTHCPSLAPLRPDATARLNPADMADLGRDGAVRLRAGDAAVEATAVGDPRVPPGTVVLLHAQTGALPAGPGAAVTIEGVG